MTHTTRFCFGRDWRVRPQGCGKPILCLCECMCACETTLATSMTNWSCGAAAACRKPSWMPRELHFWVLIVQHFSPTFYCSHNLNTSAQPTNFSAAAAICVLLSQHIFLVSGFNLIAQLLVSRFFFTRFWQCCSSTDSRCIFNELLRSGVTADTGELNSPLIKQTWSVVIFAARPRFKTFNSLLQIAILHFKHLFY